MGKNIQLTQSIDYNDSPLAQVLTLILKKISLLNEKYPLTQAPSIEEKHAHLLTNTIEKILRQFHESVFSGYSKKATPSILWLLKDIVQLWRGIGSDLKVILSQKQLFIAELYEALCGIAAEANEQPNPKEYILNALFEKESKFFKEIMQYPGENPEIIFEEFKKITKTIDGSYFEYLNTNSIKMLIKKIEFGFYPNMDKTIGKNLFPRKGNYFNVPPKSIVE